MKLKQITNAFGMSTRDFSKMFGVSRQALYTGRVGAKRMRTIVERLEALAEELHEADCAEAQRRLDDRYKAIDVLEWVTRGEIDLSETSNERKEEIDGFYNRKFI